MSRRSWSLASRVGFVALLCLYNGCRTTNVNIVEDSDERCSAKTEAAVREAVAGASREAESRRSADIAAADDRHAAQLATVARRYEGQVSALKADVASTHELAEKYSEQMAQLETVAETATLSTKQAVKTRDALVGKLTLAQRQIQDMNELLKKPGGSGLVQDDLKGISFGTAAVHCSERMTQGREYDLTAAISLTPADKNLIQQIGGENGVSRSFQTPVGKNMSVWLEAPTFKYIPEKQEIKLVSGTPAQFNWKVTPLASGPQKIIVHTVIILKVDDIETRKELQLPPREIIVDVDHMYVPLVFAKTNWEWLMSAIFIPTVLFAYRRGVNREKNRSAAGFKHS